MHFADSIVIFLLALVLFGPKKLPEIGRQIGKLLADFRRASNDFKMQIDEELRAMEQQERQKKLEAAAAEAEKNALPAPGTTTETTVPEATVAEPTILPPAPAPLAISPPSTGEPVAANSPYAPVTPPELPEPAVETPTVHASTNGHSISISEAASLNGAERENEHDPVHHG